MRGVHPDLEAGCVPVARLVEEAAVDQLLDQEAGEPPERQAGDVVDQDPHPRPAAGGRLEHGEDREVGEVGRGDQHLVARAGV